MVFPDEDEPITQIIDGRSQFIDYFPDHQQGVLLSYPALPPGDYSKEKRINSLIDINVNQTPIAVSFDWTSGKTVASQSSSNVSLAVSVEWQPPAGKGPFRVYATLAPVEGGSSFTPLQGFGEWSPDRNLVLARAGSRPQPRPPLRGGGARLPLLGTG